MLYIIICAPFWCGCIDVPIWYGCTIRDFHLPLPIDSQGFYMYTAFYFMLLVPLFNMGAPILPYYRYFSIIYIFSLLLLFSEGALMIIIGISAPVLIVGITALVLIVGISALVLIFGISALVLIFGISALVLS